MGKLIFFHSRIELTMSKIEELDACERFMSDIVPFILPTDQRRCIAIDYSVSSDEFVIKVNYSKGMFEHKIKEFVCNIIKEAQKSDLHRYNWAVHRPLCEEIEETKSYFLHSVSITITTI